VGVGCDLALLKALRGKKRTGGRGRKRKGVGQRLRVMEGEEDRQRGKRGNGGRLRERERVGTSEGVG
jgi:hypothetical protein